MVLSENDRMLETAASRSVDRSRSAQAAQAGRALISAGDEARERQTVRQAIACLWLAQELGDHDLKAIARALAQSHYDWTELQRIYLYEVAPVVHENLRKDKGVWGAFDPRWLREAIMKNMQNQEYRQEALRNREYMTAFVARDWERIQQYVRELRSGQRLTAEEQSALVRLLQAAER